MANNPTDEISLRNLDTAFFAPVSYLTKYLDSLDDFNTVARKTLRCFKDSGDGLLAGGNSFGLKHLESFLPVGIRLATLMDYANIFQENPFFLEIGKYFDCGIVVKDGNISVGNEGIFESLNYDFQQTGIRLDVPKFVGLKSLVLFEDTKSSYGLNYKMDRRVCKVGVGVIDAPQLAYSNNGREYEFTDRSSGLPILLEADHCRIGLHSVLTSEDAINPLYFTESFNYSSEDESLSTTAESGRVLLIRAP